MALRPRHRRTAGAPCAMAAWWRCLLLAAAAPRDAASEEGPAPGDWTVTTLAGTASAFDLDHVSPCSQAPPAEQAKFAAPWAVSETTLAAPTRAQVVNGTVFVMDGENGCIRAIADGMVSPGKQHEPSPPQLDFQGHIGLTAWPAATPCCGKNGGENVGTGLDGYGPQDMHVTADHFYLMDSYSYQLVSTQAVPG